MIHRFHTHVFTGSDAHCLASFAVAQHVAGLVLRGPLPVGSRHLLPRYQHPHAMVFSELPGALQLTMDQMIDLGA